jgi:hypothetical protein
VLVAQAVLAVLAVRVVLPEFNQAAAAVLVGKDMTPVLKYILAVVLGVMVLVLLGAVLLAAAAVMATPLGPEGLEVALGQRVIRVQVVIIAAAVRGAVAAQQVLLVAQGLQGQRALRVQQGLLGHIYRVKLMLHILTSEQETEQHHESKIQNC